MSETVITMRAPVVTRKPLFARCPQCHADTVIDGGVCHNDACPENVEARVLDDARATGRVIGVVIGLAIRWAIFAGAVLFVVRSCS